MKLIVLLYLEDDEARVTRFLAEQGVPASSRLDLEGQGAGLAGWLGSVAPYRSRLAFTVVRSDEAGRLLEAVAGLDGLADPKHPVHALQLDVERAVDSGAAGA